MKSYIKPPQDKIEFFIASSVKFLENERIINVFQRAEPPTKTNVLEISEYIYDQNQIKANATPSVKLTKETQQNIMSEPVIIDSRIDTSGRYPKRFVTKCYFEPRQVPVKYSETMIVKIGSKKKQFFESIYYENKLEPNRWQEQMSVRVPEIRNYDNKSELSIPLQNDFTPLLQPKTIISEL